MDAKTLVVGAVVAAASMGAGVSAYRSSAQVASLVAVHLPAVATGETQIGPDYVFGRADGGAGGHPNFRLAQYRLGDGGVTWLRRPPGCVRKPVGAVLPCGDGPSTLSWVDKGTLNRFPASRAQPALNSCELIACAVFYGEEADLDETKLLGSTLGGIIIDGAQ